jgi:tetratricopeptide (TPR) repeat protein
MPHGDATLDSAAGYFNRSLEVDPRFAMAHAALCKTELGRYIITRDVSNFESAERACHRALTLDDDMPGVLAALGALYLFSGQNDKAETELSAAIKANPNLIDAYADLGEALENQGRLEDAEKSFRAMVARQPGYWYAHNALGNFLYRQSRFNDAAESWVRVTVLAPDRALGYHNAATAYYMMGDFAAASQAYERSLEIEPYVDNYSNLGLAYYYDGRYLDAVEMQSKASELRPDDARVLGRLASAYTFSGRDQDAATMYRKAIDLLKEQLAINPNDIRLNRYFAVYNASIGQIEQAQNALDHALQLQPESPGVRFDAAKIALSAGDTEQALDYLEQAKELGYSIHIIRSDPVLAPLHNDAQFKRIVRDD